MYGSKNEAALNVYGLTSCRILQLFLKLTDDVNAASDDALAQVASVHFTKNLMQTWSTIKRNANTFPRAAEQISRTLSPRALLATTRMVHAMTVPNQGIDPPLKGEMPSQSPLQESLQNSVYDPDPKPVEPAMPLT